VGDGEGLFGAKRRDDATGCVVYTQVCAARPKQASQRQEARERQAETTVEKIFLVFNLVCIVSRETREREQIFVSAQSQQPIKKDLDKRVFSCDGFYMHSCLQPARLSGRTASNGACGGKYRSIKILTKTQTLKINPCQHTVSNTCGGEDVDAFFLPPVILGILRRVRNCFFGITSRSDS